MGTQKLAPAVHLGNPDYTGWLPGAGTAPISVVRVYDGENAFDTAERVACAVRCAGFDCVAVNAAGRSGWAVICLLVEQSRVRGIIMAFKRNPEGFHDDIRRQEEETGFIQVGSARLPVSPEAKHCKRDINRPSRAHDRDSVSLPSTPPGPGAGEAVAETKPRGPRPVQTHREPKGTAEQRLYKQMHRRGRQWQEHTGQKWDAVRPKRVEAQMGKGITSSKALLREPGALSVFVDNLTQDLIDRGFDVEAADRADDARRAAATQAPASRSTVPSARSRARA